MSVTNDCEAPVRSCTLAAKAGACLSPPSFGVASLRRSLSGSARAASRERSVFVTDISRSLRCVPLKTYLTR